MNHFKDKLTIGKIAKRCGVGVETIRFYERENLISQPEKKDSGFRYYSDGHINQIIFILKAKDLGFSLKEIKELLGLRIDNKNSCKEIKPLVDLKISEINDKLKFLNSMKSTLEALSKDCDANTSTSSCPILNVIEKDIQ